MTQKTILHLVDDLSDGGVRRVLEHIQTCPLLSVLGDHQILPVRRGGGLVVGKADVIVSHLAINWRSLPSLIGVRASRPQTPILHVEHSYTKGFMEHNVTKPARFLTLLRVAYALFDRVIAVSHGQATWLAQAGLATPAQLRVIQSAVSHAPFRTVPPVGRPVRVFGAIGRLDRQKGFDLLIDAFKKLEDPGLQLNIFGKGPEERALVAQAKTDARIRFLGWHSDPAAMLSDVDAVLMPSRWEAYGLVAAEALCAGRPVLVSGVDGLVDHVQHGARVVADGDWTAAIHAMCGTTPHLWARSCSEDRFARGWKSLLQEFETARHQCDASGLSA